MDQSKPPKLGMDSEATYKEVGNGFPTEIGVKLVDVDKLVQSAFWTRKFMEDESFKELVASIRKHGITQNLLVRWVGNRLEIVIGHRRWLAARKAGLTQVPVKIRKLDDEHVLMLQFDENERRTDLTDMEKAQLLQRMIDFFDCTQEGLAQIIGKSRQWITNHLRMLKLEEGHPGVPIETGKLTERQARELLKAPLEKREEILKEAQETGEIPSARKIEERVKPKVCERCHVASSEVEEWNNHGIFLCEKHRDEADKYPERFLGSKRTKEVTEQMNTVKPEKIKDTWEHREARRRSGISRMDEAIYKRAMADQDIRKLGYKVIHQKKYVLTSSDISLEKDDDEIPIFADNQKIHLKHQERDETISQILLWRQKIKQVVRVGYEGGFSEKKADEVWAKMKKEAFENA